ncbi:MAG: hypothetical protein ACREHV_15705, partial [Rhizomicrobium sp.]
ESVPSKTNMYGGTGCIIHSVTAPGAIRRMYEEITGSGVFGYASGSPAIDAASLDTATKLGLLSI